MTRRLIPALLALALALSVGSIAAPVSGHSLDPCTLVKVYLYTNDNRGGQVSTICGHNNGFQWNFYLQGVQWDNTESAVYVSGPDSNECYRVRIWDSTPSGPDVLLTTGIFGPNTDFHHEIPESKDNKGEYLTITDPGSC